MFGTRGRGRHYVKRPSLTINHCMITPFSTAAGVAESNTIFTGIGTHTNRGSHIDDGAVLKYVDVQLWATDTTVINGLHQAGLWLVPGGATMGSEPITGWFATTDPPTEGMLDARKMLLCRPHSIFTIAGASQSPRFHLKCRLNRLIHTGDDIIIGSLDDQATGWTGICEVGFLK